MRLGLRTATLHARVGGESSHRAMQNNLGLKVPQG